MIFGWQHVQTQHSASTEEMFETLSAHRVHRGLFFTAQNKQDRAADLLIVFLSNAGDPEEIRLPA